jgi:hypothetical protein
MNVSSVDANEIPVLDHSRKDITVAMLHDEDRQWRRTELPIETIVIASAQFLRQASSGHDRFPHLDYQQRNNFCIGWRIEWLHDGTLSKVQRVWLRSLRNSVWPMRTKGVDHLSDGAYPFFNQDFCRVLTRMLKCLGRFDDTEHISNAL